MRRITIGHHVVEWVAKQTSEYGDFGCAVGIGLLDDTPKLIAGVAYAEFNGVNCVCHIASDGTRQWMTREYLRVIFDYPFNQAGVNRITVCVGEGNKDSRRLVEHFGFEREANLRGAHPTGDLIVYALWKDRCKWLSLASAKQYAIAA